MQRESKDRKRLVALLFSVSLWLQCEYPSAYNEPDNFAGLKFGQDFTKELPECKGQIQAAGKRCYKKGRLPADSSPVKVGISLFSHPKVILRSSMALSATLRRVNLAVELCFVGTVHCQLVFLASFSHGSYIKVCFRGLGFAV